MRSAGPVADNDTGTRVAARSNHPFSDIDRHIDRGIPGAPSSPVAEAPGIAWSRPRSFRVGGGTLDSLTGVAPGTNSGALVVGNVTTDRTEGAIWQSSSDFM